jgi:hypothetical protein
MERMEVHKHPHHVTHKKRFGEYLLEFFMLFLAVFLGFIAENIREGFADHHKEKEYIRALVEDLKTDSAFLNTSISKLIPYHLMWMDSTTRLLELPNAKEKSREIYQAFFIGTAWTYNFYPTERTLTQLHSEGFHLIRNKEAAEAISGLEDQYKIYAPLANFFTEWQNKIDTSSALFADGRVVQIVDSIMFQDFHNQNFVHLDLNDVPASAVVHTENKAGIAVYNGNLQHYSYSLQTAIKGEYRILFNAVGKTLAILRKQYQLTDL